MIVFEEQGILHCVAMNGKCKHAWKKDIPRYFDQYACIV